MSQRRTTEQDRAKILELLEQGNSAHSVAKATGWGKPTVLKIASDNGINLDDKRTSKATRAHVDYTKANRLEVYNRVIDRTLELLDNPGVSLRDAKDGATAIAIMVDKRRLDDGEASKISELKGSTLDLDSEFAKLDADIAKDLNTKRSVAT